MDISESPPLLNYNASIMPTLQVLSIWYSSETFSL